MKHLFKLGLLVIGFSLVSCETDDLLDADARDEFEGNWLVNENSNLLGQRNYETDIYKDQDLESRINILNFYKMGVTDSVYAIVSAIESNTLTIPSQYVNGNYFEGTGTLDGNDINLLYYVDDGNETDTVTANYTRDIN